MTVTENFTPTQHKIMEVLNDARTHDFEDFKVALDDSQFSEGALRVHLTYLRRKINHQGLDVICRAGQYRLVRLVVEREK